MTVRCTRKSSSRTNRDTARRRRETRRTDFSRQMNRRLMHESLEQRMLLTTTPELFAVRPNEGELFLLDGNNVLNVAPQELNFLFKGGANIDPSTLAQGIRVTRANHDGTFLAQGTTDFNGSSDVVAFTAVQLGGPAITVQFSTTGFQPVRVVGNTITVRLDPGITAQDVVDLIANSAAASALVTPELLAGSGSTDVSVRGAIPPVSIVDNNVAVPIGYVGLGETSNEVILRFAESLPDDLYRIEVLGAGSSTPITNTKNPPLPLTPSDPSSDREVIDFELELGAQVISVVPQPVSRVVRVNLGGTIADGDFRLLFQGEPTSNLPVTADGSAVQAALEALPNVESGDVEVAGPAGGPWEIVWRSRHMNAPLSDLASDEPLVEINYVHETGATSKLDQAADTILVYFNEDPLNPADAQNPTYYRLIDTKGTLDAGDDTVALPKKVTYNEPSRLATLVFDADLSEAYYRLDIGRSAEENNTPASAINVGTLYRQTAPAPTIEFIRPGFVGDDDGMDNGDTTTNTVNNNPADVEYFRFEAPVGAGMTITAAPEDLTFDVTLGLFDESGTPFGTLIDAGGAGAAAVLTAAAVAGPMYVRVSGQGGTTGGYTLQIDLASGSTVSTSDANTTFASATALGVLGSASKVVDRTISPQPILLPQYPGGNDQPGHRELEMSPNPDRHSDTEGIDPVAPDAIMIRSYQFPTTYTNPTTGMTFNNLITDEEKDLVREIFELYGSYLGIQFVEGQGGTVIMVGDLRAANPDISSGGPVAGLGGPSLVVVDSLHRTGSPNFGSGFFNTMLHEIGHSLGLQHSYNTIANMSGTDPTDDVYPGDHDISDGQRIWRPDSTDIDIYEFEVMESGWFAAETFAERAADIGKAYSYLDSVLTLFDASGNRIAQNDDYYSNDSYLRIRLEPGTYYVGVSSTGNTSYNPSIPDTGFGGTTDGAYQLQVTFDADARGELKDTTGTPLDGDADGLAGGVYQFWFRASDPARASSKTLFVDKANDRIANTPEGAGTIGNPYDTMAQAVAAAAPGDVIRVVGVPGLDGDLGTLADNDAYLIGYSNSNLPLEDGRDVQVPRDVTLMIDAGTLLKLRATNIDVGTSNGLNDRSHGALQVLGTPEYSVVFRSFRDDTVGGNDDGPSPGAAKADWGGMVFRDDSDYEGQGIFLNYVNHADIQHGGGKLFGTNTAYAPIHMVTARPTISHNDIHGNADSAMSANPNSFDDEIPGNRNPQLMRIGPDVHGNLLADNTINGLFVRIATVAGDPGRPLDTLQVPARFDDVDITHVIKENLHIVGNPGGALYDASAGKVVARESGRLAIDPGVVVKLGNARIELERGSSHLIAEGLPGHAVVLTSSLDDRFGAGGTFDSLNDGVSQPQKGNWGGLFFSHTTRGSIDYALVAYAGGETAIEGNYAHFAPVEIQQANVRITNSTFENNADGAESSSRNGRLDNSGSTVFVRGAQPIIVKNVFRNNDGPVLDINVSALNAQSVQDTGRSTGLANRFGEFDDNYGPLVRLNRTDQTTTNGINGMVIRGGELTTESIWDDTDIVHVLYDEVVVGAFNHDTYSGLRLESGAGESLVVKLSGDDAGFTATGERLDIQDRIGGALHVVGQPGFPVILTSINDCDAGAGLTPDGRPQVETIPGSCGLVISDEAAPYADIVIVIDESSSMQEQQEFTTTMIPQLESSLIAAGIGDGTQGTNRYGLVGFAGTFFGQPGPHDGGHSHLLNGNLWGDATEYVTAAGTLVQQIGLLDGYEGIDTVIADYTFRTDAAKFVILITDTDRERQTSPSTFDSLLADLRARDIILETIVDAEFRDGSGTQAVALDSSGNAYIPDGSGGYIISGGGSVTDVNYGNTVGGGGAGPDDTKEEYIDLGFQTGGISGDINLIAAGGLITQSFSKAITDSIVVQAASKPTGTAGDWRGIELLQYSNDRNVAVLNEVEPTFTGGQDLNGSLTTAQPLGVLASGDRDDAGNPDNDETGGSENFRLGFEVLGTISPDDPGDRDLYTFEAKAGDRIWIDLDRTGTALDSVVELLDVTGNILASSNNSWNETGTANELEQNVFLDGDWYTLNHYDAGFSVVLPGTVGETTRYLVRVRSNSAELNNSAVTNVQFHHNPGLADTITLASGNFAIDYGFTPGMSLQVVGSDNNDGFYQIAGVSGSTITLAPGETLVSEFAQVGTTLYGDPSSGQYQLQVRMRQIDEEPGSTIRYADIRFATTGILVEGLPYRSNLAGEAAETEGNNSPGQADNLGNLLESDRVVSSVAGDIGSASDVDWYTFTVDLQQIQSISGVSANNSAEWPFVFDIDYADGLVRSDTTVAVYRQVGDQAVLIYVGRESNVEDDRATISQQDLLDNGSFSEWDPFIGPVYLPEGNSVTYYVAVMSNERLPDVLDGTYRLGATQGNVRLEPVNSVQRIVEDHIGSSGYVSGIAPVAPETSIFDISDSMHVGLHVQPLTLADVPIYLSQSNPSNRGGNLLISAPLINDRSGAVGSTTDLQDIAIRTDGTLWGYTGNDTDSDDTDHDVSNTAGTLRELNPGSAATVSSQNDQIRGPVPPGTVSNFAQDVTFTDDVDALAWQRTGSTGPSSAPVPSYDVFYSVRDRLATISNTGLSKLFEDDENDVADGAVNSGQDRGYRGYIGGWQKGVYFRSVGGTANVQFIPAVVGTAGNGTTINVGLNNGNTTPAVRVDSVNVGSRNINVTIFTDNGNRQITANDFANAINGHVDSDGDMAIEVGYVHVLNNGGSNISAGAFGGQWITDFGVDGNVLGVTTGLLYHPNGTLYGASDLGEFYTINPNNGDATILRPAGMDGIANFEGLSLGPQNVEGGYYKDLIFAVTRTGTVYALDESGNLFTAFDTTGDLVPDSSSVTIRAGDGGGLNHITGLAYSPWDFNMWHPTNNRGAVDEAHGIFPTPDNSRQRVAGGTSFYFGLEQYRGGYVSYDGIDAQFGLTQRQQADFSSNAAMRDRTDLPGGGYGTLLSDPFSLAGYATQDQPTLYFTYFLDSGDGPQDAARVLISDDGGLSWDLLATNNSARSETSVELPWYASHETAAALNTGVPMVEQQVQELFQAAAWRQARIDLSNYAGDPNLMLRFDFSTSQGVPGDAYTSSSSFSNANRTRENAREGFYIDDLIVGFSERGEMVTNAVASDPGVFTANRNPDPDTPPPQLSGQYQLEIRNGANYGIVDSANSAVMISRLFDTNDRLVLNDTPAGVTLSDDFSSGDLSALDWRTNGDSHWYVTGGRARSGAIGANQQSVLQFTTETQAGNVTFDWQIAGFFDGFLIFGVDGTEQLFEFFGNGTASIPIDAGLHTFTWAYVKDGGGTGGPDAVYIDNVQFPPQIVGTGDLGDDNFHREQGQLILEGNRISDVAQWGIVVTAGSRDISQNVPQPGSVVQFAWENAGRLVPGAVIENNVISNVGQGGILFAGDASNVALAPVPYGRIINNTIYGGETPAGIGISVADHASPTLLNNLIANTTTPIAIDNTSSAVIASTLFYNSPPGANAGNDPKTDTASPFLNPTARNFYLQPGSLAVDTASNVVQDRATIVSVKTPLGIPQSPLEAPDQDVFGQSRLDSDANGTGVGTTVFKDRGAVERADRDGPYATLLYPRDNDPRDIDPTQTIVHRTTGMFEEFTLLLADGPGDPLPPEGAGVDPTTVELVGAVRVLQNGVALQPTVDYTLGYNVASNTLILTPLSGIWEPNKVYEIRLDNSLIKDLAYNPLRSNQEDQTTRFTIILGDVGVDYGDITETGTNFRTTLSNNGARHTILANDPLYLGAGVDADTNGQPTAEADGDDADHFINISGVTGAALAIHDPAIIRVPNSAGIVDGGTFTVDDGTAIITFTFDFNGGSGATHPIVYYANETQTVMASRLIRAIDAAVAAGDLTGITGIDLGNGALQISGAADLNLGVSGLAISPQLPTTIRFSGVPVETETIVLSDGIHAAVTLEFDLDTVVANADHVAVPLGVDAAETAANLAQVIDGLVQSGRLEGLVATDLGAGDVEIAVGGLADDEDGVVFNNVFVKGLATPITVTASDEGLLDAWVDWNRDGDFLDPGEQVFQFEPLTAGANALAITPPANIPSAAVPFDTYARFRLTRDGVLSPSGLALGGEVEDYQIRVISNAAPTIVTPLVNVISAALGGTTTLDEDQLPGSWMVDLSNAPVFGDVDIANGNGDFLTYTISYAPNSSSPLPIVATVNGSMLTLDLQPELSGMTVLRVTATDQVGASVTDSVTINVTSINDPPEFTPGPSPVMVDEDAGAVTIAPWATDVRPGPAAALDEAQSQTLAFLLSEISRTGNLTFVPGAQPAINAATGNLTFRATANTNGQVVYEVTLKDDGGTANGGADVSTPVQTLTITVNAVNDAPVLTVPVGIQSVDEDNPLAFSGSRLISVQDLDVAETIGGTLTVTLSATHGTLTLADGTTTGKMLTFTGDVATVNGLFANGTGGFLTYMPDPDFNGTEYLVAQVGDQGNTGSGPVGGLTVTQTVTISVAAVNDAPSVDATALTGDPNKTRVTEDTNLALPGILVDDAKDLGVSPFSLRVTLRAAHGTLTVRDSVFGGVTSNNITGSGTGTVTLIGTPAALNATLNDPSGLVYRGAANFNDLAVDHNPATLEEQLTVTVNDNGNIGKGGPQETTATIPISVTPVNDAPRIVPPNAQTLNEDKPDHYIPIIVQDVDADELPANPASAVVVTLTLTDLAGIPLTSAGTLTVRDQVPGGIDTVAGNGTITSNGTNAVTVTGSPVKITATLLDATGLHYQPAADYNGSLRLVAVVNDLGNTGGSLPGLTHSATIPISVVAVNDPPVFTPGSHISLAEDAGMQNLAWAAGIAPGPATALDEATQTVSFTVTPVTPFTGNLAFSALPTITPAGQLSFQTAADTNGQATFHVTLQDSGGAASAIHTLTITVNAENDPPEFTLPAGPFTRSEDVGPVSAAWATGIRPGPPTAVDEVSQTVSFVLTHTGTTGNLSFLAGPAISSTGVLSFTAAPDTNGEATFDVTLTDSAGGVSPVQTLTIRVSPVNDIPTLTVPPTSSQSPLIIDEDHSLVFSAAAGRPISVADVDLIESNARLFVELLASNGTLTLSSGLGLTNLTGDGTSQVVFEADIAATNAALDGLTFQPAANFNGLTAVRVRVNDRGATGASFGVDVIKVISVRVNALNDAPDIRLAGDSNPFAPVIGGGVEDHDLPITSIDILDPDVVETVNGRLFVTLSVTDGILHLSESISGGLQTSDISGNHTGSVILQATPNRINQTLTTAGGFVFEPASGFAGNVLLEIHADDQGLTGAGNVLTDSMTITITVQSENDAPVVTVPGPQATDEDQSLSISGIGVEDEDSGTDLVQVTLSVPLGRGTLTVNAAAAGNGTNQVTLTGDLTTINSVLSDPAGVVYQPAGDDYGVVNLIVTADDQGHNGDGGPQQDSETIPITIRSVNDQPTINLPGNETVAEDADLVFSQVAGNAIVVGDVEAEAGDGDVRVQLAVVRGRLTVGTNVSGGVPAQDVVGNGTATLILTGTPGEINTTLAAGLTYRGNLNYNGGDTLTALVNDLGNTGSGGPKTAQASLSIQVTPVNDPPTATNDTVATQEDVTLILAPATLTANDIPGPPDESGQVIQLVSVDPASPQHGTVSFNGTQVIYTPQPNYNGPDTFTYTIHDGDPNSTAVGTVTVNVSAVNDPPIPVDDSFTTDEDVILALSPISLIGNDAPGPLAPAGTSDPESAQTLTLTSVSPTSAKGGTVTLIGNVVRYTPKADYNSLQDGPDTFTYRVADNGQSGGILDRRDAVGTVTITVNAVNDGPAISGPATATADEDLPQSINGLSVVDKDVAEGTTAGNLNVTLTADSGTLTIDTTVAGGIQPGQVLGNSSGTVTVNANPDQINATLAAASGLAYLSAANANGADLLRIRVDDALQTGKVDPLSPRIATHTITLTVRAVNDPPVLTPQTTVQSGVEDTSLPLTRIAIADLDADETSSARLQVRLTAPNGRLTVNTSVVGGVGGSDVTGNGTGDVVLLASLSALNVTLNAAQAVTYTPAQDFSGQDVVTVTVSDRGNTGLPGPEEDQRRITINVSAVNDNPIAVDDPSPGTPAYMIDENSVLIVSGQGVLDNDIDVDDPATPQGQLRVKDTDSSPGDGVFNTTSVRNVPVVVNVDGTFTYDPTMVPALDALNNGQTVVDTFTYRAVDLAGGESNTATVTITVTGVNDSPVARDDAYTTSDNVVLDTASDPLAPSVLDNDIDAENDPLRVVAASSDTVSRLGARVTLQANGNFVYDPSTSSTLRALQEGDPPLTDTFTYVVDDGVSGNPISRGTVTITVNGGNSPPTPADDRYTTTEKAVLTQDAPGVLANDTDIDSQTLSTVAETRTSTLGAIVQIRGDGGFTYDPTTSLSLRSLNDGQTADDVFTYRVRDEQGAEVTARVTVTVTGISDPPYQNQIQNADVNGDGFLSPIDALTQINYINANGVGLIPPGQPTPPYIDPDGDGAATPSDVILVINALNAQAAGASQQGEGEAVALEVPAADTVLLDSSIVPLLAAGDAQTPIATANAPLRTDPERAVIAAENEDTTRWNYATVRRASVYGPLPRDAYQDAADDAWNWDQSLEELAEDMLRSRRSETAVDEVLRALFG